MGVPRTPRDHWVEEGLRVLATGGPDAVRVEVLAKRLTRPGRTGSSRRGPRGAVT
ncbi:transcriptional regulator [Mycobacterium tuberculosis]|nr:transcriptional regulator [Mycobacterium tuberculosis]